MSVHPARATTDLVVYVNRETGAMGIPVFFPHAETGEPVWCLLPIVHLGERCSWQRGAVKVHSAIRRGHLPAA
jgi:hypothetical protein